MTAEGARLEPVDTHLCVLGLGYVGVTFAAALADAGFRVTGVERKPEVVDSLNRGEPHIHEPGLAAVLRRGLRSGRLKVLGAIPPDCDATVFIITVGTPLKPDGTVELDMMRRVAQELAGHLKPHDLVIMRSTMRLGATRQLVKPVLDGAGVPYAIAACPERTLEGAAIRELRELPQIIGADDLPTSMRASRLFQMITSTTVRVDGLETAEMVKLIDNTYRDVTFAFANEVARLCDAAGISAAEVIQAGRRGYPRTNVPMPGPVGGPCLSKDGHILAEGAGLYGARPDIALLARQVNDGLIDHAVEVMGVLADAAHGFPADPSIAILGLAFKGQPETDDLRGTMAAPLRDALSARWPGARLSGHDPVVPAAEIAGFGVAPAASLEDAFEGAHLVVIMNNHPAYRTERVPDLAAGMARPGLIYDFWNGFSDRGLDLPPGVAYVALGARGRPRRGPG